MTIKRITWGLFGAVLVIDLAVSLAFLTGVWVAWDEAKASAVSAVEDGETQATTTVRGQICRVYKDGPRGVNGVAVRLTHPRYGPSAFAYSGTDGMYYLYNVPLDLFVLEVWPTPREQDVRRYKQGVTDRPFHNVPPICVP